MYSHTSQLNHPLLNRIIGVGLPPNPLIKVDTQRLKWITHLSIINQNQHLQLLNSQQTYIYDPNVKIIELGNQYYLKLNYCEKHKKPIIKLKTCSKTMVDVQNIVAYPNEMKYDEYLWIQRGDNSKYSRIIQDIEMIQEKGSEIFDLPDHENNSFEMLRLPAPFQTAPQQNSSNQHLIQSTKFLLIKTLDIEDHDIISQHFTPSIILDHSFTHKNITLDLKTLSDFCFPQGILLKTNIKGHGYYLFSFVLTQEDNSRVYVNCLVVKEKLSLQQIQSLPSNFVDRHLLDHEHFYAEKAYCFVSKLCHTDFFAYLLQQIYRQYASQQYEAKRKSSSYIVTFSETLNYFIHQYQKALVDFSKMEKQIQFMKEDLRIEVELTRVKITFPRTNTNRHVFSHKAIYCLFKMLSIDNIAEIMLSLLLEKKLIIVCDAQIALGYVIQALISFLYPLEWEYAILPIVNQNLLQYLEAPIPLIAGIPTSLADDELIITLNDASIVFLDCNTVIGEQSVRAKDISWLKELKKKLRDYQIYSKGQVSKMLELTQQFYLFKVFQIEDNSFNSETIKHIFFQGMLSLLHRYDQFYVVGKENGSPNKVKIGDGTREFNIKKNYNIQDLIKTHPKTSRPFIQKFSQSSHFIHFLQKCFKHQNNDFRKIIDKALLLHKSPQTYQQAYPFRYSERPHLENQQISNLKKKASLQPNHNITWSPPPKKSEEIFINHYRNRQFNLKIQDIELQKERSISKQQYIGSVGGLKDKKGSSKEQESKGGQICQAISKMLGKASKRNVILWTQARVNRLRRIFGVHEKQKQLRQNRIENEIKFQKNEVIEDKQN